MNFDKFEKVLVLTRKATSNDFEVRLFSFNSSTYKNGIKPKLGINGKTEFLVSILYTFEVMKILTQ